MIAVLPGVKPPVEIYDSTNAIAGCFTALAQNPVNIPCWPTVISFMMCLNDGWRQVKDLT